MHAPLDVCVVGAGAIGGSMAVRIAGAGARVTVVARGAHGQAIRDGGLVLLADDQRLNVRLACFDRPDDVAPQDVAVVAVKAPDLPALASALPALLKPSGRLVFAMNGIPWWFGDGAGPRLREDLRAKLDPGGVLARSIHAETIVGAVVQSSNEMVAPGVVRHAGGSRHGMILGRPAGGSDGMLDAFAALLASAGYTTRISDDIRAEIWTKTLLAASAGPVAALTGADLGRLTEDAESFALLTELMQEGVAIGRAFGLVIDEDIEARLDFFCGKAVRPSMLQDVEAGRALEVENGIFAIVRIATTLGIDAPRTHAVAALMRIKIAMAKKPA